MPAAIRASWWPTPATGTSARSRRSLATASRCSSHRTQACAAARARDGPGASTTSCDAFATPHGRELYRQRQATIEPVFGQLKFNRDFRRFQRRGRAACRSAWRLIAATHNLLKLHRHRLTAATRTFPTASRESSGPTRRSRTAAWHMDRRGPSVAAACRESGSQRRPREFHAMIASAARRSSSGRSSRPISIVRLRARYCASHSTSPPRPRSLSIAGI
jgi:hypothetical protein